MLIGLILKNQPEQDVEPVNVNNYDQSLLLKHVAIYNSSELGIIFKNKQIFCDFNLHIIYNLCHIS
jgi:hypothetical protein